MECPSCGKQIELDESGEAFEKDAAGKPNPHVCAGGGGRGVEGASSSGH